MDLDTWARKPASPDQNKRERESDIWREREREGGRKGNRERERARARESAIEREREIVRHMLRYTAGLLAVERGNEGERERQGERERENPFGGDR